MKKITIEEFNEVLNSFSTENKEIQIKGVQMVTSGLFSTKFSDIPDYYKKSLIRKVLRCVAKTALTNIEELNNLAYQGAFYEMKNGEQVLFKI